MYFDRLRFLYRAKCRPFKDSNREVWIRWFFAPEGARPFPYPTVFGSTVWRYDHETPVGPGPGEIDGRKQWVPNATLPYAGTTVLGDPDWYIEGLPLAALQGRPPDGAPCKRPPARGGLRWGAQGIQGVPGVQRGAAGLRLGAQGEQAWGPEEGGRGGLLWGAAGVQFFPPVVLGGAGVLLGDQGRQLAGVVQRGAAGLAWGGAGGQYGGPFQRGAAGLAWGGAGGQYGGPFQRGAAGVLLGDQGRQLAGVVQRGAAGLEVGVDGHGGGTMLFCRMRQAAAQTFASGVRTAVNWDTIVYDPFGIWAGASHPSRFVATAGGLWMLSWQGIWNGFGDYVGWSVYVNGVEIGRLQTYSPITGGSISSYGTFTVLVAAGDYIEIFAVHNSSGGLTFYNGPPNEAQPWAQVTFLAQVP